MVCTDSRVSWHHASVGWNGRSWLLQDLGSTNGTYAQGQRIHAQEIGPGSSVHLGNATAGPRLNFVAVPNSGSSYPVQAAMPGPAGPAGYPSPQPGPAGAWQQSAPQPAAPMMMGPPVARQHPSNEALRAAPPAPLAQPPVAPRGSVEAVPAPARSDRGPTMIRALGGKVTRIGRALDNDLVVSDLQVSRYHAEFRATPAGYEIVDLGSHNGTYVNGEPVQRQIIGPQHIVGIGHSTFRLVGRELQEFVDTGAVTFSARHLTVKVKHGGGTKVLLNDVSLAVPEKSLVAVIGPSGSGKSTMLRALTGYRPADQGDVLYDGRNLYRQFAELRQRIGLVPQDDILHAQLSVRTALRYAAKLRFPGDTETAERNRRVDEVLSELKLDIHADKRITSLSGGQRKRVSVALELLTKPSLIFLDEPTSGLDPGMDRDVMQLLRGLADDGRTVLVVTHSVAELALCDRLLVLAPGGSVAYFGPPGEALAFFGYESWADIFQAFESYRDFDWAGRYRGSAHYQMYSADIDAVAPQSASVQAGAARPPKPQSWGSQLWTLIRRYLSVIASDRGFIGLMFLLPAFLGAVSIVIPADYGLAKPPPGEFNTPAGMILLIIAIAACFSGAANSVRELIKERVIYERERATGLSRSAYLLSKVIVLGLIAVLQGTIICAIGFAPRDLPDKGILVENLPVVEMTLAIVVLGFTSTMVGLIISALVKTAEKTMPLLVLFSVVQVVSTGILFKLFDSPGTEQVAWLMPSRWAIAAEANTIDLGHLLTPQDKSNPKAIDPLWQPDLTHWLINTGVLLGMALICGFIVLRLLRRHEPEVMRS